MTAQEKRLKLLESRLKGSNEGAVIDAITSLRGEEPCIGAIKLLVDLFNSSDNLLIRKGIEEFMNDMKQSSLRSEVIEEIKRTREPDTVRMLVSSCWQSGLDYSPWASDFAMIFNTGNYETAIECFTVLEGCSKQIPRKTRDHIIVLLKENVEFSSDKSVLMNELVSVLS